MGIHPFSTAYKAAFDLAPPCVILQPDAPFFTIVDVNEKYLNLTQSTRESFLGKGLFEVFLFAHDEMSEIQVVANALSAVISTQKATEQEAVRLDLETSGTSKHRQRYWTAINSPVFDENEELAFILHCPADVTDSFVVPKVAKAIERQKEFYKSVFWQAPVAIGVWESPDFITVEINPALAQLYQKDISELADKKIFDVFPESREKWWPILTDVIATGKPYKGTEIEVNLSSDTKEKFAVVNSIIVPHYAPDGRITGVIGVNTDVTEEVTLRRNLENNQKLMRLAAESAKLGVWDIDLRNGIIHSSSHLWITGFPVEKSVYQIEEFAELILPEDRLMVTDVLTNAEKNFNIQLRIRWSDNSIHWLQLTGDIVRDKNEDPVRIVGTTLDITDTKALEKRKDELISTVSHELKTPVTSINAIAQILERKFNQSPDNLVIDLLGKLNSQIKRLTRLIHDLLDASLIEGGTLQLKNTEFMFNELLEEVITETEKTFPSHKVVLKNNPVIPCFNDKEHLRQVLTNLLHNSVKYSPGKEEVMAEVELQEKNIRFCVKDFGIGIPKDKQSHIFERFYRIVDEKHFGFQGIGIGLYISKQIIDRLKGKIWFESTENEGSTFCFTVPAFAE